MGTTVLALGLVFVAEGLIYALAPSAVEQMLAALARMPVEQRRYVGLGAVALGVALVWLARHLGV